jgi:hypothetical protein
VIFFYTSPIDEGRFVEGWVRVVCMCYQELMKVLFGWGCVVYIGRYPWKVCGVEDGKGRLVYYLGFLLN